MKVLVIDCATTGLFKWNADPTKPEGFDKSRLLEFAYILYDTKSKVESTSYTTLVKSEGFIIKGIEFHGISDTSNGISMDELLDHLESIINDFECFVSHNIDFDMKIILSEIYRKGRFQLYNSFVNKHGTKISITALLGLIGVDIVSSIKYPEDSVLYLGLIAIGSIAVGINLLKLKKDNKFMELVKNMNLSEDEVYEILHKIQRDPISKKMVKDIENSNGANKEKNMEQYKQYLVQTYKIK